MMTPDELHTRIEFGREQRHTEFKGPGSSTDKNFLAGVIRAMIGMANTPDGGDVVIGVTDDGEKLAPEGLTKEQADTWRFDQLGALVSRHVDPYVEFDVGPCELGGRTFVIVSVSEFEEHPVLSKKELGPKLRPGKLYVRSTAPIQTVEVESHVEMRRIVDRAAEAVARKILGTIARVQPNGSLVPAAPTHEELYLREAGDLA